MTETKDGIVEDIDSYDTGMYILKYTSSIVKYKNGVKHGKEIHYDPDGDKTYEVNYVNGTKEGLEISYWGNGNLYRIENNVNGECIYWIQYRENGNISMKQEKKGKFIETIVYDKDGNPVSSNSVDIEKVGKLEDDCPF